MKHSDFKDGTAHELIPIDVPAGYSFAGETTNGNGKVGALFLKDGIAWHIWCKYTKCKEYTFTCSECGGSGEIKHPHQFLMCSKKQQIIKCPSCKGKPTIKAEQETKVVNNNFSVTWKEVM